MALWETIMGEFVDIIEWLDDSNNTMVYRFERHNNEIKYGAKLTVREGQMAVLVNEGELADVFSPGMYELRTANLPILSTIQNWPHGFESPFKSEVYFFSTRRFTDLKWGTKNPIILRDPEFGPVRLRAFGSYVVRVKDPAVFLREIVGTDGHFTTEEITDQLRNIILARFANVIGNSGIPVLDLAANYDQMGDFVTQRIAPEIAAYGLELVKMLVENVSLPENVEKALDERSAMGVTGDLSRFTQYQTAQAIRAAAENPGGSAATGMGMGMGMAMANQMAANQMATGAAQSGPWGAVPPPLPQTNPKFHVAVDGKAHGPFPLAEIGRRIEGGEIDKETLVWSKGMTNWLGAGEIGALSEFFNSAPPPIPGVS